MRIDLVDTPIKVSTVDPGLVNTEFSLVRYHGDKKRADSTYNGMKPLSGKDIAEVVQFVATRDDNINIADVLVLPKAQAAATVVHRKQT